MALVKFLNKQAASRIVRVTIGAVTLAAFAFIGTASKAQAETKLLLFPAISKDKIAFVYAGDIWTANLDGSAAYRLTTHTADEIAPHFSADGKWIAFSANYDNNLDVYIVPASGGQPKRLTWHPGDDLVQDWSSDGQSILFTSRREMRNGRSAQLWEVETKGGLPSKVMQAVAEAASWSADGKQLAYQPYITAHGGSSGWRNHRGGSTPPIWIMAPDGDSYQEVPHVRASDTNPLWVNNDVYFLSDRDGVRNLYQYNSQTKQVAAVTVEKDWDIMSADAFGNQLIYNAGGELFLLDLTSKQSQKITIDINPDLPERRVQWKDQIQALENAGLSASGKRALLSARGEVFTVPLKDGSIRNLTQTSGVRERDALWSPKGDRIAFTSDQTSEQKLVISDQTGGDRSIAFSLGAPADYRLLLWGGDGRRIIYSDNHLGLWAIDATTGKRTKVDTDNRRSVRDVSISPDGRWLAFTKTRANYFADIYLFDFDSGKQHLVTDAMSHAESPAFSPDGQYLYFTASTNAGITAVGLDMSTRERPLRFGIYAAVLAADGKSPLLPKSDEESADQDKDGEDESKEKDKSDEKPPVKVDVEGIGNRIVALPVGQKSYHSLLVAENGNLLYLDSEQPGASLGNDGRQNIKNQLMWFDFDKREPASLKQDVEDYSLSADGKMLLMISSENKLSTAKVDKKLDTKPLKTNGLKVRIDPQQEWAQIFDEAWRTEKDYFYAANMHGLDWKATREKYRRLLPYVGRRSDLNWLIREMIGELQVGHNRVFGGDMVRQQPVNVGLLGADLRVEGSQYKIVKVYTGENWNPDLKAPLAAPGIGAQAGDTIHSVNGQRLNGEVNIFSLFENTVGKQVSLEVSSDGNAKNTRTVTVEPIANERMLRFWNWIEDNRKQVDTATEGKVAYVYLPDTANGGFTYFNRMFFAQTDKKALVVDERRNSGGQAANYITDILSRQYLASWKDRDGLVFDTPGGAIYGPKVMLIDQDAGSGGDFLPYSFKRMGLGKLIGKTTWGGLIGIAANRRTIDNGMVLVPFFRFFTPDNEWRVENEGVDPDMDVVLDPVKVNKGEDSQLDAAIKEVMAQLKEYKPIKLDKAPPMPKKLGE